jgi:hypothetical protein
MHHDSVCNVVSAVWFSSSAGATSRGIVDDRRFGPSHPSSFALLKCLLTMSTKTIAVLDLADLKDGQMYVSSFIGAHPTHVSDCSALAGRTFHLIQEQSFCLV